MKCISDFLLQKYSKVTTEEAETCLLKAIYTTDTINLQLCQLSISQHIEKATAMEKVGMRIVCERTTNTIIVYGPMCFVSI